MSSDSSLRPVEVKVVEPHLHGDDLLHVVAVDHTSLFCEDVSQTSFVFDLLFQITNLLGSVGIFGELHSPLERRRIESSRPGAAFVVRSGFPTVEHHHDFKRSTVPGRGEQDVHLAAEVPFPTIEQSSKLFSVRTDPTGSSSLVVVQDDLHHTSVSSKFDGPVLRPARHGLLLCLSQKETVS